jgi:drug/metabolite transporter (DMT)-like permease
MTQNDRSLDHPPLVKRPLEGLAVAAALVTVVLWASAFVGIRAAAEDLSPGPLALGRLLAGSLALGLVVLLRRPAMPPRSAWPLIVACGVLWSAETMTLNTAERFVDAGTAAMLVNVGPILIAILGGMFLGEGFPARLYAGCFVAFAGAAIIGVATSGSSAASPDATLGIVLCLVAAVLYGVGVTVQKPVTASTPALTLTFFTCVIGAITCAPFAPGLIQEVGAAQPTSIAWVVYLGLFPTAIAFTTWAYALTHTTAGRLGSTSYLVPAVAIVLGWLILGEAPPALALVGGVLAIGGVVIAHWTPARRRRALARGEAT